MATVEQMNYLSATGKIGKRCMIQWIHEHTRKTKKWILRPSDKMTGCVIWRIEESN